MHVIPGNIDQTTARGRKILLIGYGNPGRGDDGLGPALAGAIEPLGLRDVTVEIDYQLTVDHAMLIAAHDVVVFADAMMSLDDAYCLTRVGTEQPATFGSHQVTPGAALQLAGLLFGNVPSGWILAIGGDAFDEVGEGLSPRAHGNLLLATEFLIGWIPALREDADGLGAMTE